MLAHANKESIVVGGDLLMPMVKPGQLISPIGFRLAPSSSAIVLRPADMGRVGSPVLVVHFRIFSW